MKWLRRFLGTNPELRIIALLLFIVSVVLILLWREAIEIERSMPSECGTYSPCDVRVVS